MASPSRRAQISDRLADSSFVRNVVGPKVLEPAASWYHDKVQDSDDTEDDGTEVLGTSPPPDSSTLASAQAAEAFLAGPDASDDPRDISAARGEASQTTVASPGSAAQTAAPRGRIGRIKAIAKGVKVRVKEHNLNVVAAGVAFWGLLAIPATLTAVVSIYGLVASPDEVENQIEDSLSGASEEVQTIIGDQLRSVAGASGGGLAIGAVVGVVLALWTTSGAVSKIIATLNTIWDVPEDRGFVSLRGMAVALTIGAIAFVGGAGFLLAALPATLDGAGLGDAARWALNIARFPLLLVVMAVGLSVLYWAGPNRRRRFKLLTWGATIATILWLVLSGLFSFYTASFASYNETYGSLGAVVVMLLWLFITAFMVLVGAEIDAERESLDNPR